MRFYRFRHQYREELPKGRLGDWLRLYYRTAAEAFIETRLTGIRVLAGEEYSFLAVKSYRLVLIHGHPVELTGGQSGHCIGQGEYRPGIV